MSVHERLKEIRLKSGLSQAAFGAAVGVTANTQIRYEKGHRHPDTEYLQSVANKFSVNFNWLIGGDKVDANTIHEAGLVKSELTRMFGIIKPDDLGLMLKVLQLQGNSERLSTIEQSILTAHRSTDFDGQMAIEAVCKVVKKRKLEPDEVVMSHTWGVNEIIESLENTLRKVTY